MKETPVRRTHSSSLLFIVSAGLLVGSLDITAAFLDYYIATGKGPEGVLRFVASGVFGKEAFTSNKVMIFWGLIFHFIIAFGFTILFYWLYPRFRFMSKNHVLTAIGYGVFMWIITTRIVMPLSNTPSLPFSFIKSLKAISILVLMIGLPLSFLGKYHFRPRRSPFYQTV